MVKTCSVCNTTYPTEEGYFYKKPQSRGGGYRPACKWCVQSRGEARPKPTPHIAKPVPGVTTISECGHYMTTITETGGRRVEFLKNYKSEARHKDRAMAGYRSALANVGEI